VWWRRHQRPKRWCRRPGARLAGLPHANARIADDDLAEGSDHLAFTNVGNGTSTRDGDLSGDVTSCS